ncbi:MAG: hypothetical protein KKE50_05390 [Nanoarchaeota archaeon]|nr:hypothetical protein [Nanoarchaeota archaeon]
MNNKKRFSKIVQDIKDIKIQGARNIAKAALYAYSLSPTKESMSSLVHARPTEPMLVNTLHKFEKFGYKKTLEHFQSAQDKINKFVLRTIRNNSVIFTHCHSSAVVNSLVYAKKHRKRFEVYNTETRPLFQGRKTASELKKAGIKITTFIDSAIDIALESKQNSRKVSMILLGADAVLKSGVINKVGSGMIAELASLHKIPLYIVADSWKYSSHYVPIEERDFREVWSRVPKNIKIRNPAFEKIQARYIKAVISELGILSHSEFIKKAKKN